MPHNYEHPIYWVAYWPSLHSNPAFIGPCWTHFEAREHAENLLIRGEALAVDILKTIETKKRLKLHDEGETPTDPKGE